jgi:hypothetical protein
VELDALLRAHEFMRVERPPLLWETDAELEPLIRMLGEMLALGLRHNNDLAELTLNASNVTLEPDGPDGVVPGDYVGLTVSGPGSTWEDLTWRPGSPSTSFDQFGDLGRTLEGAGARFAYTRRLQDGGAITVWLPRATAR